MSRCTLTRCSSRCTRRFSACKASSVPATCPAGSSWNRFLQVCRGLDVDAQFGAICRTDVPLISQCSPAERLKTSACRLCQVVLWLFMCAVPSSHMHIPPGHKIGARSSLSAARFLTLFVRDITLLSAYRTGTKSPPKMMPRTKKSRSTATLRTVSAIVLVFVETVTMPTSDLVCLLSDSSLAIFTLSARQRTVPTMRQLHKKSFLAAATGHVCLLVILLIGPPFYWARHEPPSPSKPERAQGTLTVVPNELVEKTLENPAKPNAATTAKRPPTAPANRQQLAHPVEKAPQVDVSKPVLWHVAGGPTLCGVERSISKTLLSVRSGGRRIGRVG